MLNITEKITNHEEQILGLSNPANECGVFPDIERMKVNKSKKNKLTNSHFTLKIGVEVLARRSGHNNYWRSRSDGQHV